MSEYFDNIEWEWYGIKFELKGDYYRGESESKSYSPGEFVITSARSSEFDALDFLEMTYDRNGKSLYELACKEIVNRIELGEEEY